MNEDTPEFRAWLEASRDLDAAIFSCLKPANSEASMQHSYTTSIGVLDLLPYDEAKAFVNKALRHIEKSTGESIEEYELSILVGYDVEPRPVSVEATGCIGSGTGCLEDIEAVTNAANAEFWTVYTRRLVDGNALASAEIDHRTLSEAVDHARRLARHYNVPYIGVTLTNLDIRGLQHEQL